MRIDTTRGGATSSEAFTYDPSNRLSQWCLAASCAGASSSVSYTYDPVGNRITQNRVGVADPGVTNSTYDAVDQLTQLQGPGGTVNPTYDLVGNQTSDGTVTYTYDLAGRMTSTTTGGVVTGYRYDGDGNRRDRSTGGVTDTRYDWDLAGDLPELAAERNAAGTVTRRYVHGPTGPAWMSVPTGQFSEANHYVYHRDHLGSVTDLTNQTGAIVAAYTYEPFGAQLAATGPLAASNPLRFTGEYLDSETNDYHLRARQYDPTTGRFTATDPVTPPMNGQWVTPYAYVGNMPGVYLDPSGQTWYDPRTWDPPSPSEVIEYIPVLSTVQSEARLVGAKFWAGREINDEYARDQYVWERSKAEAAALVPFGKLLKPLKGAFDDLARRCGIVGDPGTAGTRTVNAALDRTGKVHGQLPKPGDLGSYTREELAMLRDELETSVQTRIRKTVQLGADHGHNARLAEEQALIKSIGKHLADRGGS